MKMTYKSGNAFSTPVRFVGCVLIIVGLLSFFTSILFAAALILLGLIILFSYKGIQFDKNSNSFREYISYLGIKTKKWQSLAEFPFVSVLTTNQSQSFVSRGNATWSTKDQYFDVYLLNKSHRKRLLVLRLSELKEALESAREISGLLGLTVVKFSPSISTQTRDRIQREKRRN